MGSAAIFSEKLHRLGDAEDGLRCRGGVRVRMGGYNFRGMRCDRESTSWLARAVADLLGVEFGW